MCTEKRFDGKGQHIFLQRRGKCHRSGGVWFFFSNPFFTRVSPYGAVAVIQFFEGRVYILNTQLSMLCLWLFISHFYLCQQNKLPLAFSSLPIIYSLFFVYFLAFTHKGWNNIAALASIYRTCRTSQFWGYESWKTRWNIFLRGRRCGGVVSIKINEEERRKWKKKGTQDWCWGRPRCLWKVPPKQKCGLVKLIWKHFVKTTCKVNVIAMSFDEKASFALQASVAIGSRQQK